MHIRQLPIVMTFVSILNAGAGPAAAGDREVSQVFNNTDAVTDVVDVVDVEQTQGQLARASEEHLAAAQRLHAALAASERELHGARDSQPGAGQRYHKALAEAEAARADLMRTAAEIVLLRSRLDRAKAELAKEPVQ